MILIFNSLAKFETPHNLGMIPIRMTEWTSIYTPWSMQTKYMLFLTLSCFQGFIYISSVIDDDSTGAATTRSGLRELYKEAAGVSKLLVISRVGNEKVLPWMVSTSGAVRCFDTVSLSQKLSLHRHALRPILLHVFMWETSPSNLCRGVQRYDVPAPPPSLVTPPSADEATRDLVFRDGSEAALGRDTAGDVSFRFHDFSLPNNWVWSSSTIPAYTMYIWNALWECACL